MSHPVNTEIFENLIENYQLFKVTLNDGIETSSRYFIRDGLNELVRHDHQVSWSSIIDAKKAFNEIINQKFEELSK
tara:strand:- start:832 stop:1059 length:228 start_codon:yes stop_codon:yes gene_type:complete